MIYLGNSELEFLISSGVAGLDGQGWWWQKLTGISHFFRHHRLIPVIKTLTLYPEKGNFDWKKPWKTIRPVKGGLVNAVGLTNPGINWWLENIYPSIKQKVILSIAVKSKSELQEILTVLPLGPPIIGIELNPSCSNRGSYYHDDLKTILSLATMIREKNWPLVVKLGYAQDYIKIARTLEGIANAISINGVPWSSWSNKISPLTKYSGGIVTGKPAQSHNWKMIKELTQTVSIPIIGTSIWEYEDLPKLKKLGVKAFGFGTICLLCPWKPVKFIRHWEGE